MVFYYDISGLKNSGSKEHAAMIKNVKDGKYVKDKSFNAYIVSIIKTSKSLLCQDEDTKNADRCEILLLELKSALDFLAQQYQNSATLYVKTKEGIIRYADKPKSGLTPISAPKNTKHIIESTQQVFCVPMDTWKHLVKVLEVNGDFDKDNLNVYKNKDNVPYKCLTFMQVVRILVAAANLYVGVQKSQQYVVWSNIQALVSYRQKIVFKYDKEDLVKDENGKKVPKSGAIKKFKELRNIRQNGKHGRGGKNGGAAMQVLKELVLMGIRGKHKGKGQKHGNVYKKGNHGPRGEHIPSDQFKVWDQERKDKIITRKQQLDNVRNLQTVQFNTKKATELQKKTNVVLGNKTATIKPNRQTRFDVNSLPATSLPNVQTNNWMSGLDPQSRRKLTQRQHAPKTTILVGA